MEIQPGKTKDRAKGKHTVRKRKEKQQSKTCDLLQDRPPTFHASDMKISGVRPGARKKKLVGWEKEGKWVPENKKKKKKKIRMYAHSHMCK